MSERLRVALAGAGNISYHHLVAWRRQQPAAEVVAICDPDEGRARARCAEFGIARSYSDVQAMLARESPDAVDIATPMETHAAHVLAAASAGADALCQKPLCATLAEARLLVERLPARPRLMVHENWRFRPWFRQVARWLRDGSVGTVRQVRLSWLNSGLLPDASGALPSLVRQPYMARLSRLMVGEILIHHLDVLRWLLGPLRVRAAALTHGCGLVAGETAATALLEAEDGAAVVLEGSLMAHGYAPRAADRLEILGDRGRIALVEGALTLDGPTPARAEFDLAEGYQASFDAVIAHFVECLRTGVPFETTPQDNLQTLALVEAVYDAAERSNAGQDRSQAHTGRA